MKKKLVLGLGSNLGNRYAYIKTAIAKLEEAFGTPCHESNYYVSEPWGETNQARFINMVAWINTDLPIEKCLNHLQNIEKEMGRKTTIKWGPRCIDIDILLWGTEIIKMPNLTVPHPQLSNRGFVLKPLLDILPNASDPSNKHSFSYSLNLLEDNTTLFAS